MTNSHSLRNTSNLVMLAALTAIVIVLSYVEMLIKFGPFNITLALIPIVVGAILCGAAAGVWLGLVFGLVVLISGQAAAFLGVNTLMTIFAVLLKGAVAGLLPGVFYKLIARKNKTLATFVAALSAPIGNTGVFLICTYLFFMPTIREWAEAAGFADATSFIIFGMIGINFIVEFASTAILSGGISRVILASKFARNC